MSNLNSLLRLKVRIKCFGSILRWKTTSCCSAIFRKRGSLLLTYALSWL